jgi:hypothetical protein
MNGGNAMKRNRLGERSLMIGIILLLMSMIIVQNLSIQQSVRAATVSTTSALSDRTTITCYDSEGMITGTLPCSNTVLRLDPGWIRGPIWGRINGYDFHGAYNESLLLYAKSVFYFGIGHAFNSGLYPRHWVNIEVDAWYSFFEGILTEHIIFGRIYGLPNQ